MKLIQIGSDRNVFDEKTFVAKRVLDYAKRTEELHLVVFSLKKHDLKKTKRGNLFLYPTNTWTRIGALHKAKKICQQIIDNQKDFVISTQDPFEAGFVGLKIKEKKNVKLQVQIHTDLLSPYFKRSFLNKIRLKISKRVLENADGIRVVSERIKRSLSDSGINLNVEPRVLPVINFNYRQDDHELLDKIRTIPGLKILTLARLEDEKRLDLTIKVFAEVFAKGRDINLLIGGSGSLIESLQALARKLKVEKRVYFFGNISNTKDFLKDGDIYLQTSDYEGFGMALYEARKSKLPIITTDVGLVGSVIKNGEGVLVCEPRDGECLSRMLDSVVSDQVFRDSLADFKFEDNLPQTVEEYLDKYFNLLGRI